MIRSLPALLLSLILTPHWAAAAPLTLHVATNGNDSWSGRLEKPSAGGKDGPLATLPGALKAARLAKQQAASEVDAVTILLRKGTYPLTEPVVLTPEDSGASEKQPLTIAAYPGAKPVLSGGRPIAGWKRVEGKLDLWQAEVPEARDGKWYFRSLFVNGERKQRARMPNAGYFTADGDYLSENPVKFKYREQDIQKEWAGADVELIALHKWIDLRQFVREVDTAARVVTLSGRIGSHVKERDARYYIENAPGTLDQPGEWYLDRKTGIVTYYAKSGEDLSTAQVLAPQLQELMRLQGDFIAKKPVRHVVLRGLTFADTDWTMPPDGYADTQAAVAVRGDLFAEGAVDCLIEDCTPATPSNLAKDASEIKSSATKCLTLAPAAFVSASRPSDRTHSSRTAKMPSPIITFITQASSIRPRSACSSCRVARIASRTTTFTISITPRSRLAGIGAIKRRRAARMSSSSITCMTSANPC